MIGRVAAIIKRQRWRSGDRDGLIERHRHRDHGADLLKPARRGGNNRGYGCWLRVECQDDGSATADVARDIRILGDDAVRAACKRHIHGPAAVLLNGGRGERRRQAIVVKRDSAAGGRLCLRDGASDDLRGLEEGSAWGCDRHGCRQRVKRRDERRRSGAGIARGIGCGCGEIVRALGKKYVVHGPRAAVIRRHCSNEEIPIIQGHESVRLRDAGDRYRFLIGDAVGCGDAGVGADARNDGRSRDDRDLGIAIGNRRCRESLRREVPIERKLSDGAGAVGESKHAVIIIRSLIATTDASRKSLSGPAYSKEPVSLFGLNGRFFAPAWAQKGAARRGCQDGPAGPREAAWS